MKHRALDMLIKAENIMGVYRNYSSQNNYRKSRIIRVVLEILISSVILLNNTYEFVSEVQGSERDHKLSYRIFIYHFTNFLSTFTIMICAIQTSRSYNIFVQNIVAVRRCLNTEPINKCSRKFKNFFVTSTAALCFGAACFLPLRILHKSLVGNTPTLSSVLLYISEIFGELRFAIEHIIFYIYISMIQCLLKRLNDYVSDLRDYYNDQEEVFSVERDANDQLTEERMEEWATNYILLVGCSKELSACFSFQMLFSLGLSLLHCITTSFTIFRVFLANETFKYFGAFLSFFVLIYSWSGTHLVLLGGQKLINEAAKTRTGLLKLYNTLSICPTSKSKAIKNLYLLVKANPIKIECTGRVLQGMYLIPIILSLSVSYVIVALQFNHLI